MSDINPTTASRDSFGPVGAQPHFQEPSDYHVGEHVVFHHFDGQDYEAVITAVWEPGSDVANRWVVHLDAGSLGKLKNITESGREDPQNEGTFSLKPSKSENPGAERDRLVRNVAAGTTVPTRQDLNPRPRPEIDGSATADQVPISEFAMSAAPVDTPVEDQKADPIEEVRDDQVQNEETEENTGDPGLDTPANYMTDGKLEQGDPLPPPENEEPDPKAGTTQADDDEHIVARKGKTK